MNHAPERQPGESFDQYRERRAASHRAVKRLLAGTWAGPIHPANRRATVKAAGGIRQYKRQQYRSKGWL